MQTKRKRICKRKKEVMKGGREKCERERERSNQRQTDALRGNRKRSYGAAEKPEKKR